MEKYQASRFIDEFLIKEVGRLIDNKFHFFSFIIICQGIETLGGLFDDKPFDQQGMSKKRFLKGIRQFEPKYEQIGITLYEDLRCGLAHQLRPKNRITLASEKDVEQHKYLHLHKGATSNFSYLIIEAFYSDFIKACSSVIDKIEDPNNGEISAIKKTECVLNVGKTSFNINPETGAVSEISIA